MVDWRKILSNLGGVATGKVVKYLGKFIPYDYTFAGVSAKNLILGAALIGIGEYFTRGTVRDLLELGGAAIIVDEAAHAAGINTPTPQRVVVRAAPKTVTTPRKSVIVV